ncbi:MAG: hypothetical protein F6J93_14890 [Oscillatoria sp. SIO1A7]|nr:hypothetical protein [Oscillatoria sp. SIO1A7]
MLSPLRPGSILLNAKYKKQTPMPHARCPMPHARCPMPHAQFPIPNSDRPCH